MTPGRQLGLLWGGIAVAMVALSPLAPRLSAFLPACLFKQLSGLPCPTCGATRTALALGRFDLWAALQVSPLATVVWILLILGGLGAGIAALAGRGLPALPRRLSWFWKLALVGIVLFNWAYLIWAGT